MLIQETIAPVPAEEVLDRAERYFQTHSSFASSLEDRGDGFVRFRADVATLIIATLPRPDGSTLVRGSGARHWAPISAFLISLGSAENVRSAASRYEVRSGEERKAIGAPA